MEKGGKEEIFTVPGGKNIYFLDDIQPCLILKISLTLNTRPGIT